MIFFIYLKKDDIYFIKEMNKNKFEFIRKINESSLNIFYLVR